MCETVGRPKVAAAIRPQIALESNAIAAGRCVRSSVSRNGSNASVAARIRATTRTGLPVRVASAMALDEIVPGG
jgi:hypothetical protein